MTALHIACRDQKVEMTRILLENEDVDANCKDSEDSTPLHFAAANGNLEIGSMLLKRADVDVNSQTVSLFFITNTSLRCMLSPNPVTKIFFSCFSMILELKSILEIW